MRKQAEWPFRVNRVLRDDRYWRRADVGQPAPVKRDLMVHGLVIGGPRFPRWRRSNGWYECAPDDKASAKQQIHLRVPGDLLSRINLIWPVQSCLQKYFPFADEAGQELGFFES